MSYTQKVDYSVFIFFKRSNCHQKFELTLKAIQWIALRDTRLGNKLGKNKWEFFSDVTVYSLKKKIQRRGLSNISLLHLSFILPCRNASCIMSPSPLFLNFQKVELKGIPLELPLKCESMKPNCSAPLFSKGWLASLTLTLSRNGDLWEILANCMYTLMYAGELVIYRELGGCSP